MCLAAAAVAHSFMRCALWVRSRAGDGPEGPRQRSDRELVDPGHGRRSRHRYETTCMRSAPLNRCLFFGVACTGVWTTVVISNTALSLSGLPPSEITGVPGRDTPSLRHGSHWLVVAASSDYAFAPGSAYASVVFAAVMCIGATRLVRAIAA